MRLAGSQSLIKTKSITAAVLNRINLLKQNVKRSEFFQCPNFTFTNVQDDNVFAYIQHLNVLHTDFKTRFEDVLTIEIPH